MQIGPIFRALMRNKTGTMLLVVQIALTLAVLMNAVAVMLRVNELVAQDVGYDTANLVLIRHRAFDDAYDEPSYRKARLEEDLRILRQTEGVVAATVSNGAPSATSSFNPASLPGTDLNIENIAITMLGDEQFLATVGVALVEGRTFHPEEIGFTKSGIKEAASNSVIITKPLADQLYPDGDALGNQLVVSDNLKTIVGVSEPFEGTVPFFAFLGIPTDVVTLYPGHLDSASLQFLVRVEPGRAEELQTVLEQKLLEADRGRELSEIETAEVMRAEITGLLGYANMVLGTISGLLVLTTGLGIFGLASFSVAKRRKQIGTRRALGASQPHIVWHFLTENMMITLGGIVLGLMLGLGLNFLLTTLGLARINALAVAGCIAFIAVLGAMAVLAPAFKASRVPPAVATRTV